MEDTKPPTPADLAKRTAPEDPDQTWVAHVENGTTVARVKSEDWTAYAKKNGL